MIDNAEFTNELKKRAKGFAVYIIHL